MLDPFDFILDLILLRWLLGDDDGSTFWKVIVVLLVLVAVIATLGFLLKWW